MEPLISFRDISKKFGKKMVIKNMSLDIFPKEIFGLVGVSGAGKSTLLKIFLGFYRPDEGLIYFSGEDITFNQTKIRNIVGYVTQDNSFYEDLTARENLLYFGGMYGMKKKEIVSRIDYVLSLVDLSEAKHFLAKNMSGGMQRRLDFAIALLHNPSILILDEPLTGLDIILRERIWQLILKINKEEGKTILVSEHNLNYLEKSCSRIGLLKGGEFVSVGSPSSYKDAFKKNDFGDIFREIIEIKGQNV